MIDFLLILVIVGLIVEKHFYVKDMQEQIDGYVRALMDNQQRQAVDSKPKKDTGNIVKESDEVDIEEASEKEFMQSIQQ